MAANFQIIPDEIFYQFARKEQSVDDLIRSLYTRPTTDTVAHFKSVNRHLINERVRVGQMVVVTPPGSLQCTSYESDLALAARQVDQKLEELTRQEKQLMAERYQ